MPEKKLKPVIALAPEVRKRIEDMEEDIKSSEHNVEVMEELGFDTKTIRERIAWSKKAREILLREF